MESVSFSQVGIWLACCLLLLDFFFRYRAHQREEEAAKEHNPPLHKEYVSRAEHESLVASVRAGNAQTAEQVQKLREERSRSVGGLYERIEKSDAKNQEITAALRKEVKEDVEGVQNRVTDLLGAFRELKGVVERSLASRSPFSTDHK